MSGSAEIQLLKDFVRRHLAVSANEEPRPGYYRIDIGPNAKRARKGAANVRWEGDPDSVAVQLHQRIKMLRGEGAPKLWVRAIEEGDTHPIDSLAFEGEADAIDEETEGGKGPHAPAEGLASVALRLIASQERLIDRNADLASELRETAVREALFALAAQAAQDASGAERVQAALAALEPTIRASVPILIDRIWPAQPPPPQTEQGPPPEDPGAALDHEITLVEQAFARAAHLVHEDNTLLTPERYARLAAIIQQYSTPQPQEPS